MTVLSIILIAIAFGILLGIGEILYDSREEWEINFSGYLAWAFYLIPIYFAYFIFSFLPGGKRWRGRSNDKLTEEHDQPK